MASQGFQLSPPQSDDPEEEVDTVYFDETDIESRIQSCSLSLIGKVLTTKPVNKLVLQDVMEMIWHKPMGFQTQEYGEGCYQFFFEQEGDL